MGFRQLYYTSCEVGLSGYPGFQFNAAGTDVPPEVMRRVESFTAYDPPSSVPYNADAATIAACPVNLCFTPGEDMSILANVVFVGNDYSARFGNYFAHALVTSDLAADLGVILPIELWGAPIWSSTAVTEPGLPDLPGPPPRGTLDRAGVAAFLRGHSGHPLLPALLTAVVRAVTAEQQTIILIERDSEAAARWVAAVSFLLPPALARRMSFATYHQRPAFSDLHLVATVPDADVDRGEAGFTSFLQFDLPAGRCSEIAAEPWAALVAGVGVEGAAQLWATADTLAGGIPPRREDWIPLLAAALFHRGGVLADTSARLAPAAAAWLANEAGDLDVGAVERIGGAVLGVLADAPPGGRALGQLADAARRGAAAELAIGVEMLVTDQQIAAVLAGEAGRGPTHPPLATAQARGYAADRCSRALHGAEVRTALDLLDWAARADLPLDPDRLRRYGESLVGPAALDTRDARDARDATTARLMRAWPELRDGVLVCLTREAEYAPDRVVEALTGPLGDDIGEREAAGSAALAEASLIARARRDPRLGVPALVAIIRRRTHAPDGCDREAPLVGADLLRRIWPQGRWSPGEARAALADLDEQALAGPAPLAWLTAVLTRDEPGADLAYLDDLEGLCREVEGSLFLRRLSPAARTAVSRRTATSRTLAAASGPGHQAAVLLADLDRLGDQEAQRTLGRLTELIDKAEVPDLPEIFAVCPVDVINHYLATVRMDLGPERARACLAARLYYAQDRLVPSRSRDARAAGITIRDRLLAQLEQWRYPDLRTVATELRGMDRRTANDFAEWRDLNAAGWWRRTLTRRRIRRREEAPRREEEKAERRRQRTAGKTKQRQEAEARRKQAQRRTAARRKAEKRSRSRSKGTRR